VRVSVVVASHARLDRLPILLDALSEQTLRAEQWELVVVHTYDPETARRVLEQHRLGREGRLRHIHVDPAHAGPSLQRNVGWRAAHAPLVAFTDDDCRPRDDWLERLLEPARPGVFVQGATTADPHDDAAFASPHIRTLWVDPPSRFMQTCNILYERSLLARIGGLDERAITGEDIDLGLRAQEAGAELVAAPDAVVYHAVDALSLLDKIRSQFKWQHLAYIVKKHPDYRAHCAWRIWWKEEHRDAAYALVALALVGRYPGVLLAAKPYVRRERWRYGTGKRQQLRAFREMPAHLLIDVVEVATFICGSVRYRTLLL
jgi:GT2 family glycosyltransferase